jgi:hypothetical protein
MPKIFILPGETEVGWQKSETKELDVEIQALPLVRFTQHINVLLLKNYRGMKTAMGLSLHRIDNKTHKEYSKPIWLTYTEPHDVERLIRAMTVAYRHMQQDRKMTNEDIQEKLARILDRQQTKLLTRLRQWLKT